MSSPRQTTATSQHEADEGLLTPEEVAEQRRRRRRWLLLAAVVVLGVLGWLGGRPAAHVVKAWQARRAAAQARQLIDGEKWADARIKIMDAVDLWRTDPEVIATVALYLTRVGNNAEAMGYWRELEKIRPLTAAEVRLAVTACLGRGDLDAAQARLRQVWPLSQPGTPEDWVLGTQLALRRNRMADAVDLSKRLLTDPKSSRRQQLNAALVLLVSSSVEDQTVAWKQIESVALDGRSAESMDALLLLARRASVPATGAQAEIPAGLSLPEICARIEVHPLVKVQQLLLATDLLSASDPLKRDQIIQSAVDKYANGSAEDVAALTAWLYAKGELQRILDILPLSKALTDRTLFLQYLDTLAALGRWTEIEALVSSQKFPLDPMIQQMYLARCAERQGNSVGRDVHWKAALAAAGTKPANLAVLGHYADKIGSYEIAETAYRLAIRTDPAFRDGHESLVRLLEARGQTRQLRDALHVMANLWPEDRAVRSDAAYFDALLNENVPAALDAARELVRTEPSSLPHRTALALADLRSGYALAAVDAFSGIGLPNEAAQLRSRAVAAAVLWATSYTREAQQAVQSIPRDRLLPEERELMRPITESLRSEAGP